MRIINNSIFTIITILVMVLITVCSYYGIFVPGFYARESLNWQLQSIGQDYFNFFLIVPTLILSLLLIRKNLKYVLIAAGSYLYLAYTFAIYCFDIHFNNLFLVYCLLLGISFFMLLYFFRCFTKETTSASFSHVPLKKATSVYFILIAVMFYLLWLKELIPAIQSRTLPGVLVETGLPTNPVHVIDLSLFLPGVFITGIVLWLNAKPGILFAPVILVFFILMDVSIATLNFFLYRHQLSGSLLVSWIMIGFAIFSLVILLKYFSELKLESAEN